MRFFAGGVLFLILLRLFLAATTGIVEDEAYYWLWSTRLDWGYYDHPPGVAGLIGFSCALLGKSSLGLRAACVVVGGLLPVVLVPLVEKKSLLLLLLGTLPLYTLGGVLATPDVPLLAGWAIALLGGAKSWWSVAGLGVGLAGLGKYTGWGLWPLLLAAELHSAWVEGRKPPWLRLVGGLALSGLVLAPNLLWNMRYGWISVAFQLNHGLGGKAPPGIAGMLEFLGAQSLLVSPVLFLTGLAWMFQYPKDRTDRFCWWTSTPVLVFFSFAATRSQGEANWAAGAYLGLMVGLARAGGRFIRASYLSGFLAAFCSLALVVHLYIPLVEIEKDPTARLGVGSVLADSVAAWGVEPVYTTRYQEAALLAWYRGLEAYALPGVDRTDQFDLWPVRWADHALFVRPFKGGNRVVVEEFCKERSAPNVVSQNNIDGSLFARWQVYEVHGCGRKSSP